MHWELHESTNTSAEARRLLLINGLGSPMVAYEQGFVDELTGRGFDVVRFDNRDVGKSPRHTEPYDVADMVEDTIEVLDAVGWDTAHVLGQSMGGMIAQQLTVDAPHRVESLTSLMSATGNPAYGRSTDEKVREALLAPAPSDPEGWLANRIETEKFWCSPAVWDPAWVEAKGRAMIAHGVDPAGAARQYRAIMASGNRDESLATIDKPTLVLHGSADTLLTPSAGERTAEVIPGARYVEIEGLGHDLAPAYWGRLVDEVDTFTASITV